MAKIRLSKDELKKQRDALRRYLRYLPTLQLKKQQLQIEILHQLAHLKEREDLVEAKKTTEAMVWAGLISDGIDITPWIKPVRLLLGSRNIAGVEIPTFEGIEFKEPEYDLFLTPLWVDSAIRELKVIISIYEEIEVIKKGVEILRTELRITTQRVNLFEKVKIPEAQAIIHRIKIYLGDQMANAVGCSKIAKRKIERAQGVLL